MKKNLILLFSLINLMIFSQEKEKKIKNDIFISSELGLSSISVDNYKYNTYFNGVKLKYSYYISDNFYISTSLRNSTVHYNDNISNYIELKYLDIPLALGFNDFGLLRKFEMVNSTLTIDLGVRYRFLYKYSNISLHNASNFGIIASMEFKQKIGKQIYFLIGFTNSEDISKLKTNNIIIKNINENSINMGIGYSF